MPEEHPYKYHKKILLKGFYRYQPSAGKKLWHHPKKANFALKISDADRKEIVRLRKKKISTKDIAEKFGCCHQRIYQILKEDAANLCDIIKPRLNKRRANA